MICEYILINLFLFLKIAERLDFMAKGQGKKEKLSFFKAIELFHLFIYLIIKVFPIVIFTSNYRTA